MSVSLTACNSSKTIELTLTKWFIGEFISELKLWLKLDKVRDTFHKLIRAFQAHLDMTFTAAQTLSTKNCLTARNIATCGENLNTHFVYDISYLNAAVLHIAQEYLMSKSRLYVVRRTHSHCSTTHSNTTWYAATAPRLQIRIECEYRNIILARNKAPCWWSDNIETCRNVLKCFKVFYVKLLCINWLMNWSKINILICFFPLRWRRFSSPFFTVIFLYCHLISTPTNAHIQNFLH